MRTHLFLSLHKLFDTFADAGGGAGGGAASSPASGSPAGAAASAQGSSSVGAQGAGGQTTARTLSDTDLVLIDGKPVPWGEARNSHFMPRAQYDQGVQFLMSQAKTIDQLRAQQQQQNQGGQGGRSPQQQLQQPQPRQDPYGNLESMAVVDGRTLAKLARDLTDQGLAPIANVITQLGGRINQLEQGYRGMQTTVGGLNQTHADGEFENYVTTSLKSIPEIQGLGMIDVNNPVVREIAKDLYLSHDQKDPTLQRDFGKMLGERITGLVKLVQQMQTTYVKDQKERQRQFFNPVKGAGSPQGAPAYQHKTGDQLARDFFAATSNT